MAPIFKYPAARRDETIKETFFGKEVCLKCPVKLKIDANFFVYSLPIPTDFSRIPTPKRRKSTSTTTMRFQSLFSRKETLGKRSTAD
jgi:hypothetical protein